MALILGYVEYDLPLGISDYMKMERDLTVWTTFLINFQYILEMAGNPKNDTIEFFDKFLQELIVPLYKRTGFIDSPLRLVRYSRASHFVNGMGLPCWI
ncbi:hypothetical protein Avbf_17711 [Armadillidium vulgare]|nr:hypothetical protein Avbf_17711 [Armadillidium vulgare]